MAIKTILQASMTFCFLLMLAGAAQDDDDISRYAIIANGTVTCSGNSSADLKHIPVNVRLEDPDPGRYNFRVWEQVGDGLTDSMGKFNIKIKFYELVGFRPRRWNFPQFLKVEVDPSYEKKFKSCPSGYKVEAYAKSNIAPHTSKGTRFAGVHIFPNGTRTYFEEYIK